MINKKSKRLTYKISLKTYLELQDSTKLKIPTKQENSIRPFDPSRSVVKNPSKDHVKTASSNHLNQHRLGINSIALDPFNQFHHHHQDQDQNQNQNPGGIIYTAGKDGLINSWNLNLPILNSSNQDQNHHHPTNHSLNQNYLHSIKLDQSKLFNQNDLQSPISTFYQSIQIHSDWCNDILLCNRNQTVISASSDCTIKAWSPHSNQTSKNSFTTIGTHDDYVKTLCFCHHSNWLASGGLDGKIKIWDLNQIRKFPKFKILLDHQINSSIYSVATNPIGSILAIGSPSKSIKLFDPRQNFQISNLVGHSDNVRSILISHDGRLVLSASSDTTIKLWDLSIQRCLHTFSHHSNPVWALNSNDPNLRIFHSGDRSGWLCKVDLEGCGDLSEGECVLLSKIGDDKSIQDCNSNSPNQNILKIVSLDDTFIWTATGSSTLQRWRDLPTRAQRKTSHLTHHLSIQPISTSSHPSKFKPISSASSPNFLPPTPFSPQNLKFQLSLQTSSPFDFTPSFDQPQTFIEPQTPFISSSIVSNLSPSSTQLDLSSGHFLQKDQIPLQSLVPLISPHHPIVPQDSQLNHPYSSPSIHSDLNLSTPTNTSNQLNISSKGLTPISLLSPFNLDDSKNQLKPTLTPAELSPTQSSLKDCQAWQLYLMRDSAADAIPLRDSPDELIRGSFGLIKSELLNDRRHVITIDTIGRLALWDIIACVCKGFFDIDELDFPTDQGSKSEIAENLSPHELLKLIKERIESQTAIANWCSVETQTGLLTVHLEEFKCFDAEVYADEMDLSDEILSTMKEDHRLSLGRWVIYNLFSKFLDYQLHLRASQHDPLQYLTEKIENNQASLEKDRLGHNRKDSLSTPAIKLATSSDFKSHSDSWKSAELNSKGSIKSIDPYSQPYSLDYFSLPRLVEKDEEEYVSSTQAGFVNQDSSSTDPNSSQSSLSYPQPPTRTSTPAKIGPSRPRSSIDNSSREGQGTLMETGPLTNTSNSSVNQFSSSPSSQTSTKLFARFKSLGRGSKRRLSHESALATETLNRSQSMTIETLNGLDSEVVESQEETALEKLKLQKQIIEKILSRPFKPAGEIDAPKISIPPETLIIISEESTENENWEICFQGLTSQMDLDYLEIMKILPSWLLELLFENRITIKENAPANNSQLKVTFILEPQGGEDAAGLPNLPSGNTRLTASKALRMKKVVGYVVQKIELKKSNEKETLKEKDDGKNGFKSDLKLPVESDLNSPQPLSASSSNKIVTNPGQDENSSLINKDLTSRVERIPQESEIELICNGKTLDLKMTLGSVKKFVWLKNDDIIIEYKLKKEINNREDVDE
ncbi:hypothetical protein O181_024140 [Austropuccinia psidii MF-1]|uniref:WD repeat-containing protein 48 n=1 Tax=Austropuccinia psidii MF-1 TaxID=1389203 RepID=A0A9Q3CKF3_9BASI|nr:hypothetical protein [Austropuccinia psidii MF-1]